MLGTGATLVTQYAKLLKKIWLQPAKSKHDTRVINLKGFRSNILRHLPQFEGDEQHDAHEFLAELMDKIYEDLNRVVGVKPYIEENDISGVGDHEKAAVLSWQRHLMRDKSVVVDIFQGQRRSSITCRECGYQNVHFDAFMYLSLQVNDKSESLDLSRIHDMQCVHTSCFAIGRLIPETVKQFDVTSLGMFELER
jgi:ubiquitin C-terminal hydrolase